MNFPARVSATNPELFRRRSLVAALLVLVAFKLWLVHTELIYGSATEFDALWFVTSAKHCMGRRLHLDLFHPAPILSPFHRLRSSSEISAANRDRTDAGNRLRGPDRRFAQGSGPPLDLPGQLRRDDPASRQLPSQQRDHGGQLLRRHPASRSRGFVAHSLHQETGARDVDRDRSRPSLEYARGEHPYSAVACGLSACRTLPAAAARHGVLADGDSILARAGGRHVGNAISVKCSGFHCQSPGVSKFREIRTGCVEFSGGDQSPAPNQAGPRSALRFVFD